MYLFKDDYPVELRKKRDGSKIVSCPVAHFGCLKEISSESLSEHYLTPIHQDALMRAIEHFVIHLHNQPLTDQSQTIFYEPNLESVSESVNLVAEGLSCLQEDSVRMHTNIIQNGTQIKELKNNIEIIKKSTEETSKSLQSVQSNSRILHTEIESIQETISDACQILLHNNSYIWKITDVAKKMENARSDRQTSIYSPPFYSSPTGYKMCMRLYLNGDGQARRTHLSLFFVLMRSKYDPILTWPFKYNVTFCLYDQTGNHRHIIDTFRPDIKSDSFQRPKCEMNIAAGIPKFLPLSVIQPDTNPYIRDDSMFIQCHIDFSSLPKTSLQFSITLNPALPALIQHDAVQKQLETTSAESGNESVKNEIKN